MLLRPSITPLGHLTRHLSASASCSLFVPFYKVTYTCWAKKVKSMPQNLQNSARKGLIKDLRGLSRALEGPCKILRGFSEAPKGLPKAVNGLIRFFRTLMRSWRSFTSVARGPRLLHNVCMYLSSEEHHVCFATETTCIHTIFNYVTWNTHLLDTRKQ